MPRENMSYGLAGTVAQYHQQFNTDTQQNLTYPANTVALLVSARGAAGAFVWVTADGSVPSATNGHAIPTGFPPMILPFGWHTHPNRTFVMLGSAAGLFLDVSPLI